MPEETGLPTNENQETAEKTYTQDELNKIIGARLDRERKKISEQYADYDELKADAEAFRQAQETQKTELEKAQEKLAKLEAEIKARDEIDARNALVKQVLEESKIDAKYAPLLTAADEEGLKAQAALISESFPFAEPSHNERRRPADVDKPVTNADRFAELLQQNGIHF